jgi:hypothetical protein
MAGKKSGHCLNFGSEHEFQHPEGVNTSLALHTRGGGVTGGGGYTGGGGILTHFPS